MTRISVANSLGFMYIVDRVEDDKRNDIQFILNIDSIDLQITLDRFTIQIFEWITKCVFICPQQYIKDPYIILNVSKLLFAFITSPISLTYNKLYKNVIHIVHQLQPEINNIGFDLKKLVIHR